MTISHPVRRKLIPVLALGLIVGLGIPGCASAPREPTFREAPPTVSGVPSAGGPQTSAKIGHQAVSLVNAFALDNLSLPTVRDLVIQRTTTCMEAHSFRYADPTVISVIGVQGTTILELLSLANSLGYGLAASALSQIRSPNPPIDVNLGYLASLSVSVQKAYWLALTGKPTKADDQIVLPRQAPTGGRGCLPLSLTAVLSQLPFFAPGIADEIRYFTATEFTSPALVTASRGWSRCMRGYGYEVARYDDAFAQYQQQVSTLSPAAVAKAFPIEARTARADATCYVEYIHPAQRKAETAFLLHLRQTYPSYRDRISRALAKW